MTNPLVLRSKYNKLPIKSDDGVVDVDWLTREHGKIEAALSFATSLASTLFNVLDYGADPRGVRDSSAAMNAAALAAFNAGGGTVWVPAGRYRIAAPITIPTGVDVLGVAQAAVVFDVTDDFGANDSVFTVTGDDSTLSTFTIRGNTNGTLGAGTGIHLQNGARNTVSVVRIEDTTQAAIRVDRQTGATIVRNTLVRPGRTGYSDNHGILIYTQTATACMDILVALNTIDTPFRKGVTTANTTGTLTDLRIIGNRITGAGLGGIYITGDPTVLQTNVIVANNTLPDCEVGVLLGDVDGVQVVGNTVTDAGAEGMVFTGALNATVSANLIQRAGTTGLSFTAALGASVGANVTGNTIVNANRTSAGYAPGIDLVSVTDSLVTGNVVYDTGTARTTHGIYENTGSDRNRITANTVFNVANAFYFRTGTASVVLPTEYGAVRASAVTTTADAFDDTVLMDAASGALTLNLPSAASIADKRYTIKKTDASANVVTVDANGADLIDGAATVALSTQWQSITVQSDGSNWYEVAEVGFGGGSGGGGNGVTVAVDFGASFSQKAQTVVTGQAWVTAASEIVAQVKTPSGTDPDEMFLIGMWAEVSDVVAGVGFTVTAYTEAEARGTYDIMCVGV